MITKLIEHHFAGTQSNPRLSTQYLPESSIDAAHRSRWPDFPSLLTGKHIGYTIILWPDGWKQYRYIGEEGAHCKGWNSVSVGLSMAGNFMKGVDIPTKRQLDDRAAIIRALIEGKPESIGLKVLPGTKISISAFDIGPHRNFAPKGYTQCNGEYFDDNNGKRVALNYLAGKFSAIPYISQYIKKLINSLTPVTLGGTDRDDEGLL